MLEQPIPINMDLDLDAFLVNMSPSPMSHSPPPSPSPDVSKQVAEVGDDQLLDFDNPMWDTIFESFAEEALDEPHDEPRSANTKAFNRFGRKMDSFECVDLSPKKCDKRKREDYNDRFGRKGDTCSFEGNLTFDVPLLSECVAPMFVKCEKRKRENFNAIMSDNTKCFRLSNNVTNAPKTPKRVEHKTDLFALDLFATPRATWTDAKKNRFDAMQRLKVKKLEGRFGVKPNNRRNARKEVANQRKRTKKGQFARTSKYKWVSACDLDV